MADSVAARTLGLLRAQEQTLATAESLTGGLVGSALTAVPGSSTVYVGGVVAYATEVKQRLLGVSARTVADHGVVSAECAEEMAAGVRRALGSTWAVSTTGVAGPDFQDGKPPGTVFVAVSGPRTSVRELWLEGDRAAVRHQACEEALGSLLRTMGLGNPAGEVSPPG